MPEIFDQPPANQAYCDCHFHVFNAGERAAGARYILDYSATLGAWRAMSEPSQIRRGVVVQPSFLGTDNRFLLQTLADRSDDLRGVAVVGMDVTEAELHRLHSGGVRGIRLNLMGDAADEQTIRGLPSPWWSGLLAAGLHLELHSEIGRIATLLPLIPLDMVVVLDHFAKPQSASLFDETIRAVMQRQLAGGESYITLSGAYRLGADAAQIRTQRARDLATVWLEALGGDRLLWGSDWPCTNYEAQGRSVTLRDTLEQWLPHVEDQRAALQANPQRLYWR